MSENRINEPLLNSSSELIVEDKIIHDETLHTRMLEDVSFMTKKLRKKILRAMLKMHKHFENECGDLDVSLDSEQGIYENTEAWYTIFDDSSTTIQRVIRYHYKANWETCHGVEVIIINGNKLIFVGNCGYVSSIENASSFSEEGFNFV